MRSKTTVLLAALLVLMTLFVSCATGTGNQEQVAEAVPEWWNVPPVDTEEYHFEVGYAKGSNRQTSRDWAKANANQSLAQYVSNAIESIVNTYVDDAGELATENMQSLQAFQAVSQQRAKATLTGVRYEYHDTDDGTYVLAKLPIGAFADSLRATVQEAFVENEASVTAKEAMSDAVNAYFD